MGWEMWIRDSVVAEGAEGGTTASRGVWRRVRGLPGKNKVHDPVHHLRLVEQHSEPRAPAKWATRLISTTVTLDEGAMWLTSFALTGLTTVEVERIIERV